MINPPGYLTVSKSRQFQCENCSLIFDSQKALQTHKNKFCLNSKYSDLEVLEKEFQQKSKGRDISLHGKASLINFNQNKNLYNDLNQLNKNSDLLGLESVMKNNNSILLDKQYQSVLDELTNKQSLKKKLERQKNLAYQELQVLDKRQNDALIGLKHDQLSQVLRRRKELQEAQLKIQQQMNQYEAKKKEMEKDIQIIDKQDYIYKEARYAGKLAKQREMLQEKKKEMDHKLKQKKKEKAQIQHKLNQSKATQKDVYIPPNFRKNKQPQHKTDRKVVASHPVFKAPEDSLDSLSFHNTNRGSTAKQNEYNNPYLSVGPPSYNLQNVGTQHWPPQPQNQNLQRSYQSSNALQRSTAQIFNLPHQTHSNPNTDKVQQGDDMYPYFNPQKFSKDQKLLSDLLNKNGKSQEDLFIEMLNAQEYDSLNLLAKIPKGSDLYQVKLKQYQEISKLRDEYKKQAHQKRIDKMKREFEYEKKIMEKQMQNAVWVDENRKLMLAQQINIVKDQGHWQKDKELLYQQANDHFNSQRQFMNQPSNGQNPMPITIPPSRNPYEEYLGNLKNKQSSDQYRNPNRASQQKQMNQHYSNQNINNPYQSNGNPFPVNSNQKNNCFSSNQNIESYNRRNTQPPVDTSNYMYGYKVSVQMLKNYTRSKPIKITVIVKQHQVANTSQFSTSGLKYDFSTTYHYDKLGSQLSSYNPNMSNKLDNKMNVVYKEDFTIPQNLQQVYNSRQNQLYLWIFAQEKDQTKLSNQPTIYGWYCLKITHFGQLKEGRFPLNLYSDASTYPNPSDMNKKKNKLKQEIVVQLNQVFTEKEKPQQPQIISQQAPYKPPQVVNPNKNPQSVANMSQYSNPQQGRASNNRTTPQQQNSQTSIANQMSNTNQSAGKQKNFIPSELETEFVNTSNRTPKSLDITIAQLRTLPSYTGPVKIQLSFIDSEGVQVLPRQEILSQIGSADMYNPLINYVKMIRNQKLITPSTIIFIRFLALNALDYEMYMLGFTVFYLFFDSNATPCTSNDMKQFMLSTGYFQLPIFWGSTKPFYANIQTLIQKYPIIPCASVLVGCTLNDSSKPTRIPLYGEKVYNTVLFNVEENEMRLFEEQYKRERLDSNRVLGVYLKFKGLNINYTTQQSKTYFFKTMSFTSDNTSNLFPLDYMAEYNNFFGIYFSVDKLILPKQNQNYYYFMTVCLSPPGSFYSSKKETDDLKVIYSIDAQNSQKLDVLYEGCQMVFEPKYDLNTCLIIQFKRVKVGKENQLSSQFENYAHVIIPLFKQIDQVRCVNVMKDTVNTYLGPYNPKDINSMKQDLPTYLDQLVQNAKPSSLQFSFRLMNGFFTTQFSHEKPAAPKDKKTSHFAWYSRPIDFQDVRKKIKTMIQKKYAIIL